MDHSLCCANHGLGLCSTPCASCSTPFASRRSLAPALARPHVRRAAGFFVLLWFFYIGMSVAYTYGMF